MRHREYVLRNAQVIRLEFFFCAIDHEALLDGLQTVIIRVGAAPESAPGGDHVCMVLYM